MRCGMSELEAGRLDTAGRIDLREKLALLEGPWRPGIVARVDGMDVKVARLEGAFEWHRHPEADELFLVIEGRLRIEFRDRDVWLEEGQLMVVSRGVEHRPVAPDGAGVLLFERSGTLNTGDVRSERTVEEPGWI
jgi:mannose-6-phosphate isomerase-like protein (cupin superfamily)